MMDGASLGARAIAEAGLRQWPGEWGGARPLAAGARTGGPRAIIAGQRRITPHRR
ncbi:MAG: hypothetical protein ACKOUM_12845 [Sphingopyxis sp.]